MNAKRKKSQIFSLDFVFSIAVLILILFVIGSTWVNLQNSLAQQQERKLAIESSVFAVDFLVSSPGFPEDWEDLSVASGQGLSNVGLKGSRGLSLKKLLALYNVSSDYAFLKSKIGLLKYEFRLVVFENHSSATPALTGVAREPIAYFASDSRDFFNTIDEANVTWDYYWGQGAQAQPGWGSSRNQYAGEKASIFNTMLSNQSSYKTMVVESPELSYALINSTLLKEFLQKGGKIVYLAGNLEDEILVQGLGVGFRKAGSSIQGTLQNKGFFLRDANVSSNVSSIGRWAAFSAGEAIETFVSNQTNSSEAVVAAWNYSLGRIYFVNDFTASFAGIPARNVLNIIGWRLDYGLAPYSNATFVYPQTRFAFIESDNKIPVSVSLVLWND